MIHYESINCTLKQLFGNSFKMKAILLILLGLTFVASDNARRGSPGGKKTCECGWRNSGKARIVGGEDVREGEWPMFVGINEHLEHHKVRQCGGTILTKKHVILAAHCVKHMKGSTDNYELSNPVNMTVYFDVIRKDNAPVSKTREVEKFHFHPDYRGGGFGNDIALVVIKGEFPFDDRVGPACYGMKRVPDNEPVFAMGWGLTSWTSQSSSTRSRFLKQIQTKTHDIHDCNKIYPGRREKFDTERKQQVCAYSPGKSICRGDSGGPLFWYNERLNRYVLVGVTSFAPYPNDEAEREGCTGVMGFTDPSFFKSWVFEQIKRDGEDEPCHAK